MKGSRKPPGRIRPDRPEPRALALGARDRFDAIRRLRADPDLTSHAKLVIDALDDMAFGEVMGCWPKNGTLQSRTGLSEHQVRFALDELDAKGITFRLFKWDADGLAKLEALGFARPWPEDQPGRTIALLWRLPGVPASPSVGAEARAAPRKTRRRAGPRKDGAGAIFPQPQAALKDGAGATPKMAPAPTPKMAPAPPQESIKGNHPKEPLSLTGGNGNDSRVGEGEEIPDPDRLFRAQQFARTLRNKAGRIVVLRPDGNPGVEPLPGYQRDELAPELAAGLKVHREALLWLLRTGQLGPRRKPREVAAIWGGLVSASPPAPEFAAAAFLGALGDHKARSVEFFTGAATEVLSGAYPAERAIARILDALGPEAKDPPHMASKRMGSDLSAIKRAQKPAPGILLPRAPGPVGGVRPQHFTS